MKVINTVAALPTLESVTVTLDVDELLYVAAELAGGNSYHHPGCPSQVYSMLHKLIVQHGLDARYLKQQNIADTARVHGDGKAANAMMNEMFGGQRRW